MQAALSFASGNEENGDNKTRDIQEDIVTSGHHTEPVDKLIYVLLDSISGHKI